MDKRTVVDLVAKEVRWWVFERRKKLEELSHGSMAVNPFLAPLLFGFNGFTSFEQLADFLLGGHFSTGHSTGFGKLIDEKILPRVFGTTKLDSEYRAHNRPYGLSHFDEVDHLIPKSNGGQDFLSLKASRWTIQLTMAVQLNTAFSKLVKMRAARKISFNKIVVGVFYGRHSMLTDKYDICRGINRGKKHSVVDLTKTVDVLAGRDFWAWLNNGQVKTQEWLLEGVMKGYRTVESEAHARGLPTSKDLISAYKVSFVRNYERFVDKKGKINWMGILREING